MAYGKPAGRAAPLPPDEQERLQALQEYRVLDTPPDPEFDELARLASWICGAPIALVSLVDSERQWFKARVGMPAPQTPRDVAFCAHTILDERLFVVPDAAEDERFADNPLVTDDHIRFYAGAPLRNGAGLALGALCVMDRVPRELDEHQREALLVISHQVMARLELQRALRETVQAMKERSATQSELLQQTVTLRAVLQGMGEGVIVANPNGSLRMVNRAAEAMLGQGLSDARLPDWPQRYRLFMPDGHTPYPPDSLPLARALRGEQVDNVELCLRVPGRPRRWVSSAARALHEEDGRLSGGLVVFRDVTERRLAEGRLRAQHAITRLLEEASSLAEAGPQVLAAMGQYLGWDAGELWELDPWEDVLRISAVWHPADESLRRVVDAGRGHPLRPGEGLPGRAWQQRETVWTKVGADERMLREEVATEAGLRTALALPIASAERPLGVVMLWSREPQEPEGDLMGTLHGLGTQIGQFLARRQAEIALRASEERMRMVFQRTPYPAWIYDEGTLRILAVNDAATVAYGYTRDAFLALSHRDLRAPEHRDGLENPSHAREGAATSIVRHRHADGSLVEVEESSQGLLIDGRPARCVYVKDLSEQQRGQMAMAERLAATTLGAAVSTALTWGGTLHRKLQDCAQALVHNLDLEMAGIWKRTAGAQSLDLMGAAVREGTLPASQSCLPLETHWLGKVALGRLPQWLDLAHDTTPSDLAWTREAGMSYLAGYPLLVEGRALGVIALGSSRPLSQATIDAVAALADEIALHMEREEVRAALTASEARHRAVLDNMLGGLLVIDERGFVESGNAEAERIFGYGRDGLAGQHVSVIMPLAVGSEHQGGGLNDGFKRAVSRITEWEGRRPGGESFPFELALYEMQTPGGRRFGAHIRDLSERREVERLKKEFVAMVSHELRTPLTSIRGSLSLLAGDALGPLPDEAKEVVAIAERNTVRLIHLINDILDLERLEAGRMPMYVSLHPLAAIAGRALEAVRATADQQGITIEVQPTGLDVLGDADRVVQVLVNLVSNAVKFSPRGGVVTVSAREAGEWVEVRVQDRGRGIPASHREAIFQRFQQVESSDGRQKGGTGLGLAICKTIVEQLGGSMGVESEVGQGSTFWFRLRGGRPDAGDSLLAAVAEGLPDDARDVLLLDEDEAFLGVMGRQLLSAGIPVRTARTVRQGLAQARERAPALLVLDVRFPDGDGADVVKALAQEEALRALPLLVYTSRDLGEDERRRLRLGESRFLTKSQATEQDVMDAVRALRDGGEAP